MISVCMTTYNGAQYIFQQLSSILPQLGNKDEVIVSDDGSADGTVNIVESFNDPRIKLHQVGFHSPVKNFDYALSMATGQYIFLSDQDDIWMPDKVETCTRLLETYDLVISDCTIIDSNGKLVADSLFSKLRSAPGIFKNMRSNTYYGCCMCFHRRILPIACPFPRNIPMHDIWLGFVGDLFFKVFFEKRKLVGYRRHEKNATNFLYSTASIGTKIRNRLNILRYLPLLFKRWALR